MGQLESRQAFKLYFFEITQLQKNQTLCLFSLTLQIKSALLSYQQWPNDMKK